MDCIYSPWNSLGQNTGVGSRSLLQGIFPIQGSNPGLPHCRQILYQLSHQGSPEVDILNLPPKWYAPNAHRKFQFIDQLDTTSLLTSDISGTSTDGVSQAVPEFSWDGEMGTFPLTLSILVHQHFQPALLCGGESAPGMLMFLKFSTNMKCSC